MHLLEIIRRKKLQVHFKKVKAHSGNIFNDRIDVLAKEGSNFPEIIWKDPRHPLWSVIPVWNNMVIDVSQRFHQRSAQEKNDNRVELTKQNSKAVK